MPAHNAHLYQRLDRYQNPLPSSNPVDDLACYDCDPDGPVPWIECHDKRIATQTRLDEATWFRQLPDLPLTPALVSDLLILHAREPRSTELGESL